MHRLTRLMPLALLLALVSGLAWTPAAEAVGYCSATYCANQPATKLCGCPPHTDKPGATAFCGSWNRVGACWYGTAAASAGAATSVSDGDAVFLATLADSQGSVPDTAPAIELLLPSAKPASTSCTTHSQCPTGQLCCYPCGIDGCDIKVCTVPERGRCPMYP